ncbi:MAG: hypothetical protein QW478_15365 [Candidatus Micrarchaeaceae archaeon]
MTTAPANVDVAKVARAMPDLIAGTAKLEMVPSARTAIVADDFKN